MTRRRRASRAGAAVAILAAVAVAACSEATNDNFVPASVPSSCTAASDIAGCSGGGQQGYSCSGGRAPDDGNPALVCTRGTSGIASLEAGLATGAESGAPILYCCLPYAQPYSSCTVDRTQSNCGDQAYGFSCTGAVSPGQVDSFLSCSAPLPSGGASLYCCSAAPRPADCVPDDTVPGCYNSAVGFVCTAGQRPDQMEPSLDCERTDKTSFDRTSYCCVTR